MQTVCVLFDELWDGMNSPFRCAYQPCFQRREGTPAGILLFDLNTNYEKMEKMDMAVDKIRKKLVTMLL